MSLKPWAIMWLGTVWLISSHCEEVRVAVAANFAAPMPHIAQAFEKETGHRVSYALGSTGAFYAQIKNGAPFEVLLAADSQTPQKLEQEGLAVAGSRLTYAVGQLVLYSKQPGLVDGQGRVLQSPSAHRLAIANPKLAPYGVAAMETLRALNVGPPWPHPLVQADNIAQALQFVMTENAAMGFVAKSQVWFNGQFKQGSVWVVPQHLYTPIQQDAVLLLKGRLNPAAQAFLQHLRSDKTKEWIKSSGYDL